MSACDLLGADRTVFGPLRLVRHRHLPHHFPVCGCLWCTPPCARCRRHIVADDQIARDLDCRNLLPVALCGACCDDVEKGSA